MSPLLTLKFLALLAMVGIAVFTDLRERRIPNWLTISGAATAVTLSAVEVGGFPTASVVGLVVALGLILPFFALGAFGAGDAKLLAAVGAFLGAAGLPSVVAYGAIAGGIIGLVMSTRRGVILPVLIQTKGVFLYLVTLGRRGRRRTIHDADAQTIPYGVAIAAGAVAAWFFPLSLFGVTP
jgi:prepilin peptidase CpaA